MEKKGWQMWDFGLQQTKKKLGGDKIGRNEHAVINFRHFEIVQKLHNLLQKRNYKQVQS